MRRNQKGTGIAETAASMTLMLPLLILILFIGLETATAYMIKHSLAQGAREAARNLAVAYANDNSIATNTFSQTAIYDNIRINGSIADSSQFNATWDTADPSGAPPSVTVTVTYAGGSYGLNPFPNPDPLHLGSNFVLDANATYRLE